MNRIGVHSRMVARFCWFISCYIIIQSFAIAQKISVHANIDSSNILIGEQTQIHLTVKYPADIGKITIKWPAIADTIIKSIDVVEKSKIDTSTKDQGSGSFELEQKQDIVITSFDSGYYAIPPFQFIINGDTAKPYETEPMLVHVSSIPVDTTLAIKDIKPPLNAPFSWRELIPYIKWALLGLAVLGIIIFLVIKLSKQKPAPVVEVKVKIPPHITALEALEVIKNKKLWQEGKLKQYYTEVTDTLRVYIEARFRVNAMEQTSDEIMSALRSVVIDEESKRKLKQILLLSDMVKFAKEQPLPNENEMSLQHAFEFVNGTLREEDTNSKEETK